jgi:outer membrane autotransporter protein
MSKKNPTSLTLARSHCRRHRLRAISGPFSTLAWIMATVTFFWVTDSYAGTSPPVRVQFSAPTYTFDENAGTAEIEVIKPAVDSQSDVSVTYATSNGTARTEDSDYTATNGTLTWLPNDVSSKFISVPISDDTEVEVQESFTVSLSLSDPVSGTNGSVLGTPDTATVFINDNDPAPGSSIAIMNGNNQDLSGGGRSAPLEVIVRDSQGGSIANGLVTWSVSPPGAADLDKSSTKTGTNGRTSNSITLNQVGIGPVTVTAVAQAVGSVEFIIETGLGNLPPSVVRLGKVDGDAQLASPGETLDPFVVELIDDSGQPITGSDITWTVEPSGAGSLINDTTTTDNDGKTSNTLTLDPSASGAVTVTAETSSGAQVEFNVNSVDFADISGLSENEKNTAEALDNTCDALEGGTEGLEALAAACSTTGDEALTMIEQVTPNQIASQGNNSVEIQHTQFTNINLRMFKLRGGAIGASANDLALNFDGQPLVNKGLAYLLSNATGGAASADEPSPLGRLGLFINGSGSFGDTDSTDDELGFDFDTAGITAGADYRITDTLILGGALGYVSSDFDFDNNQGDQDVTGYTVSAYGTWYQSEKVYVDGILSYGWNDFDMERRIIFGTTDVTAEGSPDGTEFAASIGAGYDFNYGAFSFGPFGRVGYIKAEVDDYEEDPAGGLEQAYEEQDVESLTTLLGGQVSYAISTRRGVFLPQLRFEWAHEFEDDSEIIVARFLNDPTSGSFNVGTDDPDTDYFNLGAGVSAVFAAGRSAFIYYETSAGRDDITEHSIAGGLRFEF